MSRFSASDAAVEGFRVIRSQWRLVVGWALFNVLGLVAASVLAAVLIGIAAVASTTSETAGAVGGAIGGLVLAFAAFAVEVMIVAALFRRLLRDEPPGFLHLRFGPDELRVAAVWLVMLSAFVAGGLLALYLSSLAGRAGGWRIGVPAIIVLFGALGWLALRLSLAAPIAVAERRIGFAASWRLTKGHTASLLGMAVLTFCLLAMIMVLAWLALALISGAATGWRDLGLLLRTDANAVSERPGFYAVQLLVQFLFAPVLWVISQAPLVAAYLGLKDEAQA
ncbi:hypothetical protein [Phenylobacterium sp.]|uniref:hypothetical protein n=1 Tax=Phenylobacterium sp. TaxID=1871053 RepID=UPI002C14752A|nr:hypothetical protein [Phenylobacterium sp.]HVI33128.1 hypothetical protein [Phenylobacterium sp.]